MAEKKFVTRAFVQKEDEQHYSLEYYIIDNTNKDGKSSHGIEIDMSYNDRYETASVDFPGNRDYVLDLIELFAKNYVMPVSLYDLVEDL